MSILSKVYYSISFIASIASLIYLCGVPMNNTIGLFAGSWTAGYAITNILENSFHKKEKLT